MVSNRPHDVQERACIRDDKIHGGLNQIWLDVDVDVDDDDDSNNVVGGRKEISWTGVRVSIIDPSNFVLMLTFGFALNRIRSRFLPRIVRSLGGPQRRTKDGGRCRVPEYTLRPITGALPRCSLACCPEFFIFFDHLVGSSRFETQAHASSWPKFDHPPIIRFAKYSTHYYFRHVLQTDPFRLALGHFILMANSARLDVTKALARMYPEQSSF